MGLQTLNKSEGSSSLQLHYVSWIPILKNREAALVTDIFSINLKPASHEKVKKNLR